MTIIYFPFFTTKVSFSLYVHIYRESASSVTRRARLPTEPGPDTMTGYNSPLLASPIKSPPSYNIGTDSDDNSYQCESAWIFKKR